MKFFRKLIHRIKTLRRYIPVLWNSYDWDYRYALELFEMKLEDLATYMESDKAWSAESKQDAKRIRLVLRLMKKVYDEDYATEYLKELEDLFGEGITDFDFIEVASEKGEEGPFYKLQHKYEILPNSAEIYNKQVELFRKSQSKQQKAHRLLWKLVEHNIRRWWD